MSKSRNKNSGMTVLLSVATGSWLIYDMATATEAPSQALMIMQYILLALMLIGLVGSAASYIKNTPNK